MEDRTGKARRLSVTRAENKFLKVQTLVAYVRCGFLPYAAAFEMRIGPAVQDTGGTP
jgi:hypothetical protein